MKPGIRQAVQNLEAWMNSKWPPVHVCSALSTSKFLPAHSPTMKFFPGTGWHQAPRYVVPRRSRSLRVAWVNVQLPCCFSTHGHLSCWPGPVQHDLQTPGRPMYTLEQYADWWIIWRCTQHDWWCPRCRGQAQAGVDKIPRVTRVSCLPH